MLILAGSETRHYAGPVQVPGPGIPIKFSADALLAFC